MMKSKGGEKVKRKSWIIANILLFIFIISIGICPNISKAEGNSLSLNSIDYQVVLNTDGSIRITENWDINNKSSGTLFKTFDSIAGGITDVSVKDISTNLNGTEYNQISTYQYHVPAGSFQALENEDGKFEIAWGVKSKGNSRKYQIQYTVKNAVNVYSDVAELYWQLIGKDNSMPIDKMTATIILPEKVENKENLRAWAHGPLNGNVEIVDNKTVKIECEYVDPEIYIEPRVAILEPNMFLEANKREENKLQTILAEEQGYADEANRKRETERAKLEREAFFQEKVMPVLKVMADIVIGIVGGGFLIINLVKYIGELQTVKKVVPSMKLDYYREIPREDATPAEAAFLHYNATIGSNMPKVLSATMLDLCLKGYLQFEIIDDKNVKVTLVAEKTEEALKPYEQTVYELLKEVANKQTNSFTMKEFEKYARIHGNSFMSKMDSVEIRVNNEEINIGNMSEEGKKKKSTYMASGIAYITITIAIAFFSFLFLLPIMLFFIPILLLVNSILCFILSGRYSIFSQAGLDEKEKWEALKRYMEDFSMIDEKSVPELVLWEKYLVYATAFGIADKVLKQLKIKYPEFAEGNLGINDYMYLYLLSNSYMNMTFISTFNRAVNNAYFSGVSARAATNGYSYGNSSSGGGFGGGFSGGGGFGGGGGRNGWQIIKLIEEYNK